MRAGLAVLTALSLASPASPAQAGSCHIFSVWHYHFPQRCPVVLALAAVPPPPARPPALTEEQMQIALPSLENMEFPHNAPDERLKSVGVLRLFNGTN